ncbi:flagellar hook-associated protein 2 [Rummeliibacillus sp. JY-2-4R]
MASVSSNYSYMQTANNRITGLASGIDTESMVEKLMKAESAPMEKLQQQKQQYEWQRDAYRDVNTKLSTFSTTLFDQYALQGNFSSKTVSVSDINKVSVTASSNASGTLNIQSVSQLATVASITSTLTGYTSNLSTLKDLGITNDGSVTLNVIQSDGSIKETTIDYKANDTLDTFMKNLNNSGAGITALEANGNMSLTANATGSIAGGAIAVKSDTNSTSGVFQKMGFLTDSSGEIANGQNAKYTVNGLDMESTSNTFTISGYSVTLKNQLDATASPITISSSTNVDAMVDKIKDFIKTYNDLITSLNDKVNEAKYKDYPPLTDAQKSQMSEDQITKWEEKAKSGSLRSDSIVRNALSNLRGTLYKTVDGVDGKYNALYTIGVTTTSSYTDGGKLQIDETKLREALNSDPDSVMKLFTQSKTGVVAQMRTIAQDTVKTIEARAGKASSVDNTYTLGKQLVDINGKISDWKDRLKDIENRYFKQFSAMEDAIQKANSQASYFSQG